MNEFTAEWSAGASVGVAHTAKLREVMNREGVYLSVFATGQSSYGPDQWSRPGRWAVDLEGFLGWGCPCCPSPHVERSFPGTSAGLERALAFARFLEWCVDGLTDEQLVECARVTDGRLL